MLHDDAWKHHLEKLQLVVKAEKKLCLKTALDGAWLKRPKSPGQWTMQSHGGGGGSCKSCKYWSPTIVM